MTKKEFNDFVSNVSLRINSLQVDLGIKKIEYSRLELEQIEKWYAQVSCKSDHFEEVQKTFISYIGSYLIKNIGGDWHCEKNPNLAEYGQYTVLLYEDYGYCVCPMDWLDSSDLTNEAVSVIVSRIIQGVKLNYKKYLLEKK